MHANPEDEQPTPIDPRRPFTRAAGLASGLSRRALGGPDYRSIGHGILVSSSVPDSPRLRTQAALLPFVDSAFASHCSAARAWEAPIRTCPQEHVTVAAPNDRRRRDGVVCHVRDGATTRKVSGVPVTELAELLVEMADELPLVELVVLGDWMLRRKGLTRDRLAKAVDAASGPSARRAHQALGFVRPKVDSPMESRLRMLLVLAGIPEPEVNRDGSARRHTPHPATDRGHFRPDGRICSDRDLQRLKDLTRGPRAVEGEEVQTRRPAGEQVLAQLGGDQDPLGSQLLRLLD